MKTKMTMGIDGAWLTNLVRQVWVEGDMAKAMDILNSGFPDMPETTKLAICMGKKKLVGVNNMRLEDDNVTESHGIKILTMAEQLKKREAELDKREAELKYRAEMETDEVEYLPSPYGRVKVPNSMLQYGPRSGGVGYCYSLKDDVTWEYFEDLFPGVVAEARLKTQQAMEGRRQDDILRVMGMDPARVKAAKEAVLESIMEPQPEGPPEPDTEFESLNGWLSPDGTFYGCGFMGHVGLAFRLGSSEGRMEKSWVKVQDAQEPQAITPRFGNDFFVPDNGVTQAQYDAMFAWCEKHGRKLPENLEVI